MLRSSDNRDRRRAIFHGTMPRNRLLYVTIAFAVALAGLGSRRYGALLPSFVAEYAGDTLWATMVYFATAAVMARSPSWRVAAVALAGSYAVEVSQLYQAPWILAVRRTTIGGLILGHGFLWSDVVCYTAGVALGLALERCMMSISHETSNRHRAPSDGSAHDGVRGSTP